MREIIGFAFICALVTTYMWLDVCKSQRRRRTETVPAPCKRLLTKLKEKETE